MILTPVCPRRHLNWMKQFYNASIDCCFSIIDITDNTSNTSAGYENKTFITKAQIIKQLNTQTCINRLTALLTLLAVKYWQRCHS